MMKNQYVGDIGDYGKYSLLRFLALHGIKIGINWYLTDNDNTSDGNITDYLKKDSDKSLVYSVRKAHPSRLNSPPFTAG